MSLPIIHIRRVPAARGRAMAALAVLLCVPLSQSARAQTPAGEIVGLVFDRDGHRPVTGVTVLASGPQGEQATVTDDKGAYALFGLPAGSYTVRFVYRSQVQMEQPEVVVVAAQTVRVNARVAIDVAPEEVHVVKRRAAAIDVGSSRTGVTLDEGYVRNAPAGANFGELLERAPGAAGDSSGGVSMSGATGLENGFLLDGVNVGGVMFGDLGTNLSSEFIQQIEMVTGGADAEWARALGGTANVITKSGGNKVRGSVFSLFAPGDFAATANTVDRRAESISGVERLDWNGTLGAEVGGPILRDRLFFWAGVAPTYVRSHVDRSVNRLWYDSERQPDEVSRRHIDQSSSELQYGLKLDYVPAADHRLSLALFGTPSESRRLATLNGNPDAMMGLQKGGATDLALRWMSRFWNRALTLEGTLALHRERVHSGPANSEGADRNGILLQSGDLYTEEGVSGCAPDPTGAGPAPCPVTQYAKGGYGGIVDGRANRITGQLKSTLSFRWAGQHRLKLGAGYQLDTVTQRWSYTGPDGGRALVNVDPGPDGDTWVVTYFDPVSGERGLVDPERYRDAFESKPSSGVLGAFVQDSYTPTAGLTLNLGMRWDWQRLFDPSGQTVIDLRDNIAPRLGIVFDPWRDGRSKLFAHIGRVYEVLPMNVAAGFSGMGMMMRRLTPDDAAALCSQQPATWSGRAQPGTDWRSCDSSRPDRAPWMTASSGENVTVQANLKGQHQDELVAGLQHEILPDLVLGVSYARRMLRTVIEDTYTSDFRKVVGNPGQVPDEAVRAAQQEAERKAASGAPDAAEAAATVRALAEMGRMPRPERTYDGLTVTVAKRFSRGLMLNASYTYSRTQGNYVGLYDGDAIYRQPNTSGQYDYSLLTVNRFGRLPTDRPHILRIDGYYLVPVDSDTTLIVGAAFRAMSGQPTNYQRYSIEEGYNPVFLLPRGSGGRTPFITQLDARLGIRHRLTSVMQMDVFVDLFNVLDQRTATAVDQTYTNDSVAPVVGGTANDLKYSTVAHGAGVTRNANFGNPISYQAPFSGRVGVRISF